LFQHGLEGVVETRTGVISKWGFLEMNRFPVPFENLAFFLWLMFYNLTNNVSENSEITFRIKKLPLLH